MVWGGPFECSLYGGTFRRKHDNISVRDQKMYTEVVGVVAACDIMKWTTGVGVIGPRWVDTGENTRNWSGGPPKKKQIGEGTECDT